MKTGYTLLKFCLAVLMALAMLGNVALADYTVSGQVMYEDLEMDFSQAFSGNTLDRPVRYADILILSGSTTLAQGATDANGNYSISVSASSMQDIQVLVVTNTTNTSDLNLRVVEYSVSSIGDPWAFVLYEENGHDPNSDVAVGTVTFDYHQGGDEFNLFDCGVDALRYLIDELGEPTPPGTPSDLIIEFTYNPNGTGFAFYQGISVNMDGALGYDDTIALHEIGHWVQDRFGDFSDNPGGQHFIGDSQQDPRLSFGEGWPTFFGANVRTYYLELTGNEMAYRHPSVYISSNGAIDGGASFSYDLEDPGGSEGEGAASEVAVQAALWDITDNVDTPDFSPGEDDDEVNGYYMNREFKETWDFITEYLAQPPFSGFLTYEDFYDEWVANVENPQEADFNLMQYDEHGIEYFEDEFEPNNTLIDAVYISEEDYGTRYHNTSYPEDDLDHYSFTALEGVTYLFSTSNMLDGADTYIEVKEFSGTTLAENDNVGAPGLGEPLRAELEWQAPAAEDYIVLIYRSSNNAAWGGGTMSKYGNWDFRLTISDVPETFAAIDISPPAPLVVTLPPNSSEDRQFTISNDGTEQALTYTIDEYDPDTDEITDFSWLSQDPTSGTIDATGSETITVTFNSYEFQSDTALSKRLWIESNDLLNPVTEVIVILVVDAETDISPEAPGQLPTEFALLQNFPNPFNPTTTIQYALPQATHVTLTVYNTIGQKVTELVSGHQPAGYHTVDLDATEMVSGVYFYQIATDAGHSDVKKMLIVK